MPIQYYSHFRLLSVCQVHSMGLSIPVGKYYSHKWGAFGEREKKWKAQLDINRQTNCLINYAIELSNIFPKWNYYWSSILFWAPAITVSLYLQFRPTIHHAISVYPSVVPHPSAQLQTTAFQTDSRDGPAVPVFFPLNDPLVSPLFGCFELYSTTNHIVKYLHSTANCYRTWIPDMTTVSGAVDQPTNESCATLNK